MKNMNFENFNYSMIDSAKVGYKEVLVTFTANGKSARKIFFFKEAKGKNANYYLSEAKKLINHQINNGTLAKTASKQMKRASRGVLKPVLITMAVLVAVGGAGYGGYVLYEYLNGRAVSSYLIDFNTDGGSYVTTQKVEKGKTATRPTDAPIKTGYTFLDWYTSKEGEEKFNFDNPVNSDATAYAHWSHNNVEIKFNANGGVWEGVTEQEIPVQVPYGTIPAPDKELSYEGHSFTGWDKEIAIATEPTTYVAQWDTNQVTIYFDTDGGPYVQPKTIDYGGSFSPKPITRTGYTFDGWMTEKGGDVPFDFTKIKESGTAYAKWTVNSYNALFYPNGGTWAEGTDEYKTVPVNFNTLPVAPEISKEGSTFTGWKRTSDGGIGLVPAVVPDQGDTTETYTAQWDTNQVTISFDTDGGTPLSAQTVDYGTTVTPGDTTKDGFTFIRWVTEKGGDTPFNFNEVKVSATAYASWTINSYNARFYPGEGGSWVDGSPDEYKDVLTEFSALPIAPGVVKTGSTFAGWKRTSDEGIGIVPIVVPTTEGTPAETYTAQWEVNTEVVSIDPNGGTFNDGTSDVMTIEGVEYGTTWSDFKGNHSEIAIDVVPEGSDPDNYSYQYYDATTSTWVDIQDTDKITSSLSLKVAYQPVPAESFLNDSWLTFTNFVNSHTYADIVKQESPYYDEYISDVGGKGHTFVGLERKVNINGTNYRVRVIDEYTSAVENQAKFVFEFANVLDLPVPYSLDSEDNAYDDSYIHNYLNNSLINMLPTELSASIKDSDVKYYDTNADTPIVTSLTAKLFVLSASELGFPQFPDGNPVKEEGAVYKFYMPAIDGDKKKTSADEAQYRSYWTRSADVTGALEAAWDINTSGTLGEGTPSASIATNSGDIYIAPAFKL